jgi:serine phosphatase RsbU (regulator of sigma subunit)
LLGFFDTITTSVHAAELAPGDTIIFYTDGITDLPSPYGRTAEELAAFIAALPRGLTARELGDAICADLAARVPDPDRHDDVALLIVRDARPPASSAPDRSGGQSGGG